MKVWEDFEWLLRLFVGLLIVGALLLAIIVFCIHTPGKAPISLSETEKLLSDIRNNSNDREIMNCARLHIQEEEEILLGDMWDFYDCKKRVLQDRLKRAISESPDAKN